jgi:transposase
MPRKRYLVRLPADERTRLHKLLKAGAAPARQLARVHILLLADEGYTDATIATMLHVGTATVARIRHKYVQHGLTSALTERSRPGGQRKLAPTQEAYLVALACSDPPQDQATWTMRLLADQLVELGVIGSISDETVRRTLKKMT